MIRNRQQLNIAERKRGEALESAERADDDLQRQVLQRFAADVQEEIDEFRAVTCGSINVFHVGSFDDLAEALVKGRLARGWTQKQLASELEVSEQMVQKDEDGGYERASLTRLADVADALGYTLIGELRPTHLPEEQWCRAAPWPVTNQIVFGEMGHYAPQGMTVEGFGVRFSLPPTRPTAPRLIHQAAASIEPLRLGQGEGTA
jgi:transcriptional regulator with XRE-family HTH domain